jgi:hypothetical protein
MRTMRLVTAIVASKQPAAAIRVAITLGPAIAKMAAFRYQAPGVTNRSRSR